MGSTKDERCCRPEYDTKYGKGRYADDFIAGDEDKDGNTNVEEYINDTDPTKFIDYRKPENNVSSLHRADTIHRRAGK